MMSYDQNQCYVTLLSTASRNIYDLNTHADFMVKLAQPIDHLQMGSGRLRNFVLFISRRGKPRPTLL